METIYSTENSGEAEKLKAQLIADGIPASLTASGGWTEVQVPSDQAPQAFRTLTHFLKG